MGGVLALTNATVHTGDAVVADRAVVVRGERIAALVAPDAIPRGAEVVDLGGATVAPGYVDLQVNGGGDRLLNDDPTPEAVAAIAAAHRRRGTTGLLPTFITGPDDARQAAIEAVGACLEAGVPGVLGIHLEGPFLNPAKAGVHDPALMRRMTRGDLARLPAYPRGRVLLTVAPEMVDDGVIAAAARAGVKVSAGHTDADRARIAAALDEGLDGATHLFNAMRPLASREPGAVGALLADDRAWCGLIVDGVHVHPDLVRLAWRANAPGRTFLVSDAMPPVGGRRRRFAIGGRVAELADGRCRTADGVLAGSAIDLATAVRTAVHRAGIPAEEALRMASTYPARYLGVGDRLGRIAPGCLADLVVLDDALHVRAVVDRGRLEPAAGADGAATAPGG